MKSRRFSMFFNFVDNYRVTLNTTNVNLKMSINSKISKTQSISNKLTFFMRNQEKEDRLRCTPCIACIMQKNVIVYFLYLLNPIKQLQLH